MCGILGFLGAPGALPESAWAAAGLVQAHRGPDDRGSVSLNLCGRELRLAHQRLSIIDLSAAGHQPMGDSTGLGWIVFNGEIYNYPELREELIRAGRPLGASGDTGVLLNALAQWGARAAVERLNGMWSFAWLEPGGRRLWLARDRAGEKPLYWTRDERGLYFASEVKTLLTLTGRRRTIDAQAVGQFLVQSIVDCGQGSFFSGIEQIPAATLAAVDLTDPSPVPRPIRYWQPRVREQGPKTALPQRIADLRETFLDAVRLRLRSDVPVGILLSGGLDSSAIAAAAHRVVGPHADLHLLSAVSADRRFDESTHIDRVAAALGRPVTRVSLDGVVSGQSLIAELEQATWYNDAPIGSLSNLAHRRLMASARGLGVTVLLSGQGADELLCGYKKYLGFYLQQLMREGRAVMAMRVAWQFWRNGTVLNQFNLAEAKRYLPAWLRPRQLDLRGPALREFKPLAMGLAAGADVRERQAADLATFSIPVLTHFEDRMSMSEGREIRLPFLDPRLIDQLIAAPAALKLHHGWTKYLMRRAVEPWLPPEIVWRKDKQGFVNPESEWLKGGLREQVLGYFEPDSLLFRYGLVDRRALLQTFETYARQPPGRGSVWFRDIFNPFALEVWLRRFESYLSSP
jgi:asparagine synthase (glutamine-hydrolysing)